MPAIPHRERLLPYKLLVYLERADPKLRPWIARHQSGLIMLRTGPASRALRLKLSQLHDALTWLQTQGYIGDVTRVEKGYWTVQLRNPNYTLESDV